MENRFNELAMLKIAGRASAEESAELEQLLTDNPDLKEAFEGMQRDFPAVKDRLPMLRNPENSDEEMPEYAKSSLMPEVKRNFGVGEEKSKNPNPSVFPKGLLWKLILGAAVCVTVFVVYRCHPKLNPPALTPSAFKLDETHEDQSKKEFIIPRKVVVPPPETPPFSVTEDDQDYRPPPQRIEPLEGRGPKQSVSGKATFVYLPNFHRIPVALQTTDNNLSIIVKRAFRLHGGFKVVSDNTARYILRFEVSGSNGVRLGILPTGSGSPESFPVQGADLQQAALFAADTAVERLTKRPGFFAGRIVFVIHQGKIRELYTSDLFFKGYRKLTSHRHQVISPDWSPDGSRILYSSNHKGGMDILMLDVASRVPRTIASYRGSNLGATFDPYGRRAAMILNRELFINDSILNPNTKPRRLTHNNSSETSPSWSGDGRRMIISSDIKGGAQLFEVYLSGSNSGRLRHIPTNISRECTEPAWNPTDPNILAFTASIGGRSQIVIYDFATKKSRPLSSNTDDVGPSWTNDGRHLVFAALKGGAHQLQVLDTFTNKRTELHTSISSFSSPDFVYPH